MQMFRKRVSGSGGIPSADSTGLGNQKIPVKKEIKFEQVWNGKHL
jgi:hypothetical protein